MTILPGDPIFRFLVFHLPANPEAPVTRSYTAESLDVSPVALMALESTLRLLPSPESFMVAVPVTFPLTLLVVSQVVALTAFHEAVVPHGVEYSLPSVLKVYDCPSEVCFISPLAACS